METLQKLRKEFKTFGKVEIFYDVYNDRVNFVGFNSFVVDFFSRRNVVADYDRAGVSISKIDAQRLGIPTENR